ncbi:MAG TPA: protein kinase [Bryobacteraceae bacterium]
MNTPAADIGIALATMDASGEFPRIPRVGPYQLEKRIGRGGMGSVWLASRFDHEYERKVAVKMVKRGMDTTEILQRFKLERQVLAGLDHPNIARLIDGGSTPEGLPYLVMEYVEGKPIDQYCESKQIPISDRLKLFRHVCAAVQYAHSNLVVHRDIKASNILVTADGGAKLLDFGIAKLIRSEFSTLAAAETRPEMRPMTLDYASPEQVRGDSITTATDVYSLGVLLYKLLTGKFPYGPQSRSRLELQQAICDFEPLRPSSVVLTDAQSAIPQATQQLAVTSETRDKARKRLKKKLAGDLDVIILKALRKEPVRRYASVEQFSEDIRRYLEGRPVTARSDTFGYRTSKFLRRNAAVATAMTVAMGLLLGATAMSVIHGRRDRELLRELEQREVAMEPELIGAHLALGDLYEAGDAEKGRAEYRKATEEARGFLAAHPDRGELRGELGWALVKLGQGAEALKEFETALRADPKNARVQEGLVEATRRVGFAQIAAGDRLAALSSFSRALQAAEGLGAGAESKRLVAECNFDVGETLSRNGAGEAAVAKLRKALEVYRELVPGAGRVVGDGTVAGIEGAVAKVAEGAPAELRGEMERELGRWR